MSRRSFDHFVLRASQFAIVVAVIAIVAILVATWLSTRDGSG